MNVRLHIQTLPDYVMKTSIVKWDGTQVNLTRAEDPRGFAIKAMHFGLLGVTVCELPLWQLYHFCSRVIPTV